MTELFAKAKTIGFTGGGRHIRSRVHNPEPDGPPQAIIHQHHPHPVSGGGPGCPSALSPLSTLARPFWGGGVRTAGGVTILRLARPGTAKTG